MKTISFNRITIAAFAVIFTLVLFSCQKENSSVTADITEEEAATYSDESAQAEASFDDAEDLSMIAAEEDDAAVAGRSEEAGRPYLPTFEELRLRLGPCVTITVTPNDSTYPKTITIDFGDGCVCADGKFRKGAIIIHLTAPIRRSGAVMTITFRNFYLNRAHIQGTKIVTNLSENGNIKFTVQVVNGSVNFPNGRGYQYDGLKYVAQIEGGSTRTIRDDVYKIEGRSKTQFNSGLTINLNTESPLIKKVVCPWISDGTLKIKINSRLLFLDYGAPNNGDCDNKALLTWNNGNNHRLITLP
ncbi:MAG TPA: hypothetical protein VMZ03_10465 [Chitinophagaceae bacterium]|nr:hypothetical protein [Chitinophagaceae bacterium]